MRISDDRYNRDLRRHTLAIRLIRHQARTDTIIRWTGLSAFRIRALFNHYVRSEAGDAIKRPRGGAPHSLAYFFRSSQLRFETAMLGSFCRLTGVLPTHPMPEAHRDLPSTERGELLCTAFETFRIAVPESQLTFEHAVLLATALARAEELFLSSCNQCNGLIVISRTELREPLCIYCSRDAETVEQLR